MAETCNYTTFIGIDCTYATTGFTGYLFVNETACEQFSNDLRPTPENIVLSCKCICGCNNVYCKFESDVINISTSVKSTSSKPTTTATSPTTTNKETGTTKTEEETTSDESATRKRQTTVTSSSKIWTHPPAQHTTSSSESTTFTKQVLSKDNFMSDATIGGAIGGVIILILAVVLVILIRQRRSPGKLSKQHDPHHNSGTLVNSAYDAKTEMDFTNTRFGINGLCASNRFDPRQDTHHLHDSKQEYTQTTVEDKSQKYVNVEIIDRLSHSLSAESSLPENGKNSNDYELLNPISEKENDNHIYFKLEQELQANNYVEITRRENSS